MIISEAIAQATTLTGQVVDNTVLVRWLSELDGQLAFEFYRIEGWTPYDPVEDLGSELLVPFPWDGAYVHHLAAQTYFTNGEYDRYENERVMANSVLSEFRAFMQRTQAAPCCHGFPTDKTGGTGVTVIPPRDRNTFFWLNAYTLAVMHGFQGTMEEWLASLVGEPGVSEETFLEKAAEIAENAATASAAALAAESAASTAEAEVLEQTPQMVSDWLDEHVDPETGYVIDDSLSVEGAAADAKAAGDAIADAEERLSDRLEFDESVIIDPRPVTSFGQVLKGNFDLSFPNDGDMIISGTQNVADMLISWQGTKTHRDVTITTQGNTITISGKPSSNFNYGIRYGYINSVSELQNMTLPVPERLYTLSQKVTQGTVFPVMAIRHKSSGNVVTVQDNTVQFTMSKSTCGGLYLVLDSSKTYNCTFVVGLIPFTISNASEYRSQTSHTEQFTEDGIYALNGYTWRTGSPTATELVSKLPRKPLCKYSTRTVSYSFMVQCLDVYIPAKEGYINYVFGHCRTGTGQSGGGGNVWRLVQIDYVSSALAFKYHLTQLGETEMAIMIVGRDDFIGGVTHGDEWMDDDSLLVVVDGAVTDVTTLTNLTEFSNLQVFLTSTMYDPDDHSTVVGTHSREWLFNLDGLYIDQNIVFQRQVTLGNTYAPMLPAIRGNDSVSDRQITDTYVDDGNYGIYDIGTAGFRTYPNVLTNGVKEINLYGQASKIHMTLKILEQPEGLKGSGRFVYNAADTYNKVYCTICGYGNTASTQETIPSGTKWKIRSQISVDVG